MSDNVKYELTMTAEAEVIPGPLTRIRMLCEQVRDDDTYTNGWNLADGSGGWTPECLAADILKIIDEG